MSDLNTDRSYYTTMVLILVAVLAGCNELPMDPFCSDPAPLLGNAAEGWTDPVHPYSVGFIRWTTPEEGREIAEELEDALDLEVTYISIAIASFSANMTWLQRDLVRCDRRVRYVQYRPNDWEEP